jgi:hypothetical protein
VTGRQKVGPMRVLFTLLPGIGSLHPLLPLARAARDAGHEVAFCSSPSFRPAVAVHGFRYFAAGLDWTVSDADYIRLCAAAGGVSMPAVSGLARLAWVTDHLFIGAAATRLLPDLFDVAREFCADVIVRENLEYAGCVAAEALGLPHACVAAGAEAALDQRRRTLRAALGLARVVPPNDRTPARVRQELQALLHDPSYAARAAGMAADIAAVPPVETAMAVLEALVRSRRAGPVR